MLRFDSEILLPSCGQNGAVAMWSRQQVAVKSLSHVVRSIRNIWCTSTGRICECLHIAPLMKATWGVCLVWGEDEKEQPGGGWEQRRWEGREERENDTETGAKLFSESRMRTGVAEEVRETTMRSRLWRQGSGNVQQEGCCSRCFSTFESKVGDMGSGTMSGHLRSVQTGSQTEYVRLERLQLRWSELVCPFASDDILIQPVKEMGYFNEVRFFFLILIMQNPSKLLSFCMLSMV